LVFVTKISSETGKTSLNIYTSYQLRSAGLGQQCQTTPERSKIPQNIT